LGAETWTLGLFWFNLEDLEDGQSLGFAVEMSLLSSPAIDHVNFLFVKKSARFRSRPQQTPCTLKKGPNIGYGRHMLTKHSDFFYVILSTSAPCTKSVKNDNTTNGIEKVDRRFAGFAETVKLTNPFFEACYLEAVNYADY
jgi:hypothetical protein